MSYHEYISKSLLEDIIYCDLIKNNLTPFDYFFINGEKYSWRDFMCDSNIDPNLSKALAIDNKKLDDDIKLLIANNPSNWFEFIKLKDKLDNMLNIRIFYN